MGEAKTIGVLLFDGFEELDAIGPWEVLAYWVNAFPEDGWAVTTFARTRTAVTAAKGLVVQPQRSATDTLDLDVLIYPGGRGTREQLRDDSHLEWVRELRKSTPLMTSVCTGSLVFAAAGLLTDRPATTHWNYLDQLAALDPSVRICPDERFVDDGDVITSAGVSAGIDMALHLVARLSSTDHARQVRVGIQYNPEPPI